MSARAAEPRKMMIVSTFVALVLQVIPLPDWLNALRPAFGALAVLYWSISAPRAGGIALGFFSGIVLDVFRGAVLGQHALAFSLVTYLAVRNHLMIRNKPLFEQALIVCAALVALEVVVWAIDGWSGQVLASRLRWIHPVTGAAIWPLIVMTLSRLHTQQ